MNFTNEWPLCALFSSVMFSKFTAHISSAIYFIDGCSFHQYILSKKYVSVTEVTSIKMAMDPPQCQMMLVKRLTFSCFNLFVFDGGQNKIKSSFFFRSIIHYFLIDGRHIRSLRPKAANLLSILAGSFVTMYKLIDDIGSVVYIYR